MLVKKIQLNKKKGSRAQQSIYIGSKHFTNTKRFQSVENESQQHSRLSSNRELQKISSQLGLFCRFLPSPCNQSCAVLRSFHFCIHHCTGNCTGELDRAEEERSLAGLVSDIGGTSSPLNLRLGFHLVQRCIQRLRSFIKCLGKFKGCWRKVEHICLITCGFWYAKENFDQKTDF